jgi:outer membrane phospholipase A
MTRHRHRHPTRERIVRWFKPSAESLAAAAAVYGPELMLQLKATPRAADGLRSPERGWQHASNGDLEGTPGCPAR